MVMTVHGDDGVVGYSDDGVVVVPVVAEVVPVVAEVEPVVVPVVVPVVPVVAEVDRRQLRNIACGNVVF
jgi:hypothetical protein